ncbi:MAG: hypothetical protein K2X87_16990 [Gemmataceae bacterium]|nr:hypothetical protein [Gemmataceae bacterium]
MTTLLIWTDNLGVRVFLLPADVAAPFHDCDDRYINDEETDQLRHDKLMWLNHATGAEPWPLKGPLPTFDEYLREYAHREEIEADVGFVPPPEATPLRQYELAVGPDGACQPGGFDRVIRAGWEPGGTEFEVGPDGRLTGEMFCYPRRRPPRPSPPAK